MPRGLVLILALLAASPLWAQDPPPPPPPQQQTPPPPDTQELERLRRQQEEELRARQRILREMDAEARESDRILREMAEQRRRASMLPEFIKNAQTFEAAFRELAEYSDPMAWIVSPLKQVKKHADTVEDRSNDLLKFVLAGEKATPSPEVTFNNNSHQNKVLFLLDRYPRLFHRLRAYIEDQRKHVVDLRLATELVRELQIVKSVSRSLQK